MKRLLPLILLLLFAIVAAVHAQGPGISYPPETETLRDVVSIQGTANHSDFWKYELAAAPFGTQNFFDLAGAEAPVIAGVLGRWDTRTVADGPYTLRLRVVRRDGNYDEYFVVRVQVANAGPPPTPTGQVTPTPTVTPTPKPATATAVAAGQSGGDSNTSGGEGDASGLAVLTARIGSLGDAFVRGGGAVLLVFLAIGVFFGVKHLLTWLYYRLLAGR